MTPTELDARLRAAWEAVLAARTARLRAKLLPAAMRATERAKTLLEGSAPGLAPEAVRLAALVRAESLMTDPTVGDLWALVREAEALRAEGVPPHLVARSAIRVGACTGPLAPKRVQACAAKLRQGRLRFHASNL